MASPLGVTPHGDGSKGRGAKRALPRPRQSPLRTVLQIEQGIPKAEAARLFERVAAGTSLPVGKLRAQIIPDSSWKRAGERLRPTASQTVARLKRVLAIAENIWGNEDDAIQWLTGRHRLLGGATPYSILKTEEGARAVESILAALEYGFCA